MNRIYFEALMITIKMGKKFRLYIFCCLNFLLFSLRGFENPIFISHKFLAFGKAPLMLRIICKTLLILFLFYNLLFLFIHSELLFSKTLLFKKKLFLLMTIKNDQLTTLMMTKVRKKNQNN